MVKYTQAAQDSMSLIFQSLADPTRRDILLRLSRQDLTVTEVAQPYTTSLPAISKHLKVLEKASLIKRRKIGRIYQIHLEPHAMKTIEEYISYYKKFWNTQFDNLEKFLKKGGNK